MKGKQLDIACECWFTSTGNTMPLMFKFVDESGQIHTVKDIKINYKVEKNYNGISSIEYDCTIIVYERSYPIKLVFFKEECRWIARI